MSNVNNTMYSRWMQRKLNNERHLYDDCGEINCTKLAEDCANEFDYYEGDDYTIPEALFDLAVNISKPYE